MGRHRREDDAQRELDDLLEGARRWRDDDPDPRTRAELDDLLRAATGTDEAGGRAHAELADRFAGTLQFGTAGLRGEMAAGPNRMNRAVVIRAAAGLAAYLRTFVAEPHVVVGYDARHDSDVYARDTCAVMVAAGCSATVLPRPLPTPVLAHAVRAFDADAGVMVTASHNPPRDNGYKVYLGGRVEPDDGKGAQIVPPHDTGIAAAIAAVGRVLDVPLATDGWTTLDDGVLEDYLAAVAALVGPGPRDLAVVLTPLHGVGGDVTPRVLTAAGFAPPFVVPAQAEPDPAFPTVAFPNPEEPGALDLALAAAAEQGADLVVANDPDADRCAVAVPTTGTGQGTGWRMLRGDELGVLLGEHVLSTRELPAGAVVACSVVSSSLLEKVAAAHGVRFAPSLTGFKWISRVPGLVYGYEEALGYCVAPDLVRDKDGVSAALLVAELAAGLKQQGRTLLDALDDLERRHGVHATDQLSLRVQDLSLIGAAMERLRAHPPERLAGAVVTSVEDLAEGVDGLPPTDGLRLRADGGIRVVVRPSGTEPKLKCYLESVQPVGEDGDALAAARHRAADVLSRVRTELAAALAL